MSNEEFIAKLANRDAEALRELDTVAATIQYVAVTDDESSTYSAAVLLSNTATELRRIEEARLSDTLMPERATVQFFNEGGLSCGQEQWRIPDTAIDAEGMKDSPDYREINTGVGTGGCIIVVPEQAPWFKPAIIKQA